MKIKLISKTNEKTGKTIHSCPDCQNGKEKCYTTFPGEVDVGSCDNFSFRKPTKDTQPEPWCNWHEVNKDRRKTTSCPGGCGRELYPNEIKEESLCSDCLEKSKILPLSCSDRSLKN